MVRHTVIFNINNSSPIPLIILLWSWQSEPFLKMSEDPLATGNERFEGYVPDLIKELSKELGKTLQI